MKKYLFIPLLLLCIFGVVNAQKSELIKDILKNNAAEKVERFQKIIGFSADKVESMKEIEYAFLLDVQKAENCCLCNSVKKVEKLKAKRDDAIKKILSHDEFLKYDALQNERIKKYPVRVKIN